MTHNLDVERVRRELRLQRLGLAADFAGLAIVAVAALGLAWLLGAGLAWSLAR